MGGFFTATSMIGFIANAGIIVRNSIILVDFIRLRSEQGMTLEEAVVDAGAVRFRPMLIPRIGHFADGGEAACTLLSRMAVPVLYYMSEQGAK